MFYIVTGKLPFGLDYSAIVLTTLCYAGLLSLLGLALTLRHRASGIPDFSVVTYLGLGAFVTALTILSGFNLYLAPVFSFVVGCIAGFGQYRCIMIIMERRGDSAVRRTLSTIGVQILGAALMGAGVYMFLTLFGVDSFIFHYVQSYDFSLFGIRGIYFVAPLLSLGVYIVFLLFWRRAPFSVRLTASEENPELAMVQGVDPWRVKTFVWVLSGGIACAAGSLFPPFLHTFPESVILAVPIMAVGVLGGFESLLLTVVAAWIIGVAEMPGTLWLQINFGTMMGEYRPVIPVAIIYFTMLLIPRGLIELKELYVDIRGGVKPVGRRLAVVSLVVLALAGMLVVSNNVNMRAVEEDKAGWINVSNQVGLAGAKIYPDTRDPHLSSDLYFENVYPPSVIIPVSSLREFTMVIDNRGSKIVYLHDGTLYLIRDSSLGYSYNPQNDNFGR
jgi:branched-chain amino acid transport system permease protein